MKMCDRSFGQVGFGIGVSCLRVEAPRLPAGRSWTFFFDTGFSLGHFGGPGLRRNHLLPIVAARLETLLSRVSYRHCTAWAHTNYTTDKLRLPFRYVRCLERLLWIDKKFEEAVQVVGVIAVAHEALLSLTLIRFWIK